MSALYKNFVILRKNYDKRSADNYFFIYYQTVLTFLFVKNKVKHLKIIN